ncbi:MAG TPA: DUF547 domain-containing protein [Terriglobia bacterium]|nr:DUF547 domain-containing protein [Terriglobia bacterium]
MGTQVKIVSLLLVVAWLTPAQHALSRVDASAWDALLKQFVDARHRVDYARLKREGGARISEYVTELGRGGEQPLSPDEKKALLINAYNAFTIEWVVENYPVPSIWATTAPFTAARHRLGGEAVSLDAIESELRAMGDPRIHAALVCAARSCPPLRREAYVAKRLDAQLDDNVRAWLADSSLNTFDPEQARAEVSTIFRWYAKDFDAYPGGLEGFLRRYAPAAVVMALGPRKFEVRFKEYNWGLNDQSELGSNYSKWRFEVDWLRNWLSGLIHR